MPSRNQDFTLGLTVIALFGLFLVSFFFLMRSPLLGPAQQTIELHFSLEEGMAPLAKSSPVLLRDAYKIGEVTSIELASGDADFPNQPIIVVEAVIDAQIKLYSDCRITTNQPVIGGGGFVSILDVGNITAGEITEDYIRGQRPQSLQAAIGDLSDWLLAPDGFLSRLDQSLSAEVEGSLMQKVMLSLDDINAMTSGLRDQLSAAEQGSLMAEVLTTAENINRLTAALREQARTDNDATVLAKLHVALTSLNETLVDVREIVSDARPKVSETLASVSSMAAQVDEQILGQLRGELNREDSESLIGRIHLALKRADAALENIVTITDAAEQLVILNQPDLDRTIALVAEAAEELTSGINELRTQPWRLLFPPDEKEKQKVVAFEAARLFATAASDLNQITERLEALKRAEQASGKAILTEQEVEQMRQTLHRTFEKFGQAEQYLWEQVK
jgi:ABC-type transporter Mla subunit MlaD